MAVDRPGPAKFPSFLPARLGSIQPGRAPVDGAFIQRRRGGESVFMVGFLYLRGA